jgi:hypothetical protein
LPLGQAAKAESDSSHINRVRKAIGRELIEVQSANWPNVLQYYTADVEYHDPIVTIHGIDMMAEFLARLFDSSPDLVTTIEDETCINGIYSAAWTMEGFFNGVPYSAKGMSIIKFRSKETQVYYQRDYYTEGDIMANIPGLDEAILGFRTYYKCAVDPTFDCPLGRGQATALDQDKGAKVTDREASVTPNLRQNHPNPFNPSTTISFDVPAGGEEVGLRIYDAAGRLTRTLVDGYEHSGTRTVSWDGKNDDGQPMASGVYYYQITTPTSSDRKMMMLLK